MKSQTGVTANPSPVSALVYDESSFTVPFGASASAAASVIMSPTLLLSAYLLAGQQPSINVPVEHVPLDSAAMALVDQMPTAKAITKAHEDSGLTWEQLARIFGVSRRAVHMWANGARMNATNAELLMRLIGYLDQLDGGPDDRRAALLSVGEDGLSAIDQFRSHHTDIDRRFDGLPRPDSLLGALHGDATA